ncbi:MAG: nuclear transport factor 2 family protein [Acidobacteria bacterium]|nr:nuclear transport factor 2 family protein [Acidobacteriota bacterium]
MEPRERHEFVSPTEPTVPLEVERELPPPRFDEKSIRRAQPAVPLKHGARARSWPLWVIVLCMLGGVLGGVLGGLALTLYQRGGQRAESRAAQPQVPADAPGGLVVAPTAAPVAQESKPPEGQVAAVEATPQTAPAVATHEPAPDAVAKAEPKADVASAEPSADVQGELRAALGGWLAATNERDVGRQMSYYAPTVEAFYLSRNAPRESVRAEKTRLFARASAVNVEAAPPEIRVSPDGRTAVMRFRKRYRIDGEESRAGEVLQELRWRRTNSGWKIVGERDLRVLQ